MGTMLVMDLPRLCTSCGEHRPPDDFPARGRTCLICRRAYGRRHYEKNRRYYVVKAKVRRALVIAEVRAWIAQYLRSHPCLDCGERDVRTLEFDHRDRSSKTAAVAVLARGGYSLQRVRAEIDRCDVRCANCHRIRTHAQRGWWGSLLAADGLSERAVGP